MIHHMVLASPVPLTLLCGVLCVSHYCTKTLLLPALWCQVCSWTVVTSIQATLEHSGRQGLPQLTKLSLECPGAATGSSSQHLSSALLALLARLPQLSEQAWIYTEVGASTASGTMQPLQSCKLEGEGALGLLPALRAPLANRRSSHDSKSK